MYVNGNLRNCSLNNVHNSLKGLNSNLKDLVNNLGLFKIPGRIMNLLLLSGISLNFPGLLLRKEVDSSPHRHLNPQELKLRNLYPKINSDRMRIQHS